MHGTLSCVDFMGDIPNNPLSKSLALVYFEPEVFIRTPSVHRGVGKGKESGGRAVVISNTWYVVSLAQEENTSRSLTFM